MNWMDRGWAAIERVEPRRLLALTPAGSEFLVNTDQEFWQSQSAVAMNAAGDFVVVWDDYFGAINQPGDIYGQRFNAAGVPQGIDFRVNEFTTGYRSGPAVATDAEGNFVVAWTSTNQGLTSFDVFARRFDANGTPQGDEFRVNVHTPDRQGQPSVTMLPVGGFVVTWESFWQDEPFDRIYARRYGADGQAQGGEIRVSAYTSSYQRSPAVAADADGDFVVVWHSTSPPHRGMYARRYSADGTPQGGEFRVNTHTTGAKGFAHLAMHRDGSFVVAWQSEGQDGASYGIYARRYHPNGAPEGDEFRVNTYTTGGQRTPTVAIDDDKNFTIAWRGQGVADPSGIYAQRYDAAGAAKGAEFLVNTYTRRPVVAHVGDAREWRLRLHVGQHRRRTRLGRARAALRDRARRDAIVVRVRDRTTPAAHHIRRERRRQLGERRSARREPD